MNGIGVASKLPFFHVYYKYSNMSKINKIRLSGTTYDIEDSGATKTVEVTQAEYDALVSGGTVDPNTFYVITDATAADLSQYWTSAQTQSAITNAVSGKADTSAVTESINAATSGKVDTSTYETYTAATDTALSGKQDTLSAGTGIDITDNVISATGGGGGGGTTYSAGTNIEIDSANTINCTLPIYVREARNGDLTNIAVGDSSNVSSGDYFTYAEGWETKATGAHGAHAEGYGTTASGGYGAHAEGWKTEAKGNMSHAEGEKSKAFGNSSHAEGYGTSAMAYASHSEGWYTKANNQSEHASGQYNNSVSASTTFGDSGNTLFSVGNGTADSARHNAFEIRQNGDIYITSGSSDIKLQDHLGGGGGGSITIDPSLDSGSTNAVANSAITVALDGKQDTLSAGIGIEISGNVISATGGGGGGTITIDPTLDSGSTNAVANSAITEAIANATDGKLKEDLVFSATCGYGSAFGTMSIPNECKRINIYPAKSVSFLGFRSYANYYIKCFILDVETKTEYNAYWNIYRNTINSSGGDGINYVTLTVPDGWANFSVTNESKYRIIGFERDVNPTSNGRNEYHGTSTYTVNIPSGTSINEVFGYFNAVNSNYKGLSYLAGYGTSYELLVAQDGGRMYYGQTIYAENSPLTAHTANTTIHVTSAQTDAWNAKVDSSAITSSVTSASTDSEIPSAKAVYDIIPSTTSAVTSGSTAVVESGAVYDQLGGMKILKLTESEYTALVTKDSNTLYVVVADPSN